MGRATGGVGKQSVSYFPPNKNNLPELLDVLSPILDADKDTELVQYAI